MDLSLLNNGTPNEKKFMNPVVNALTANDVSTQTLEVKGVPITPPQTGQYNANIVLTNATNFSDSSGGTQYYQVGNMWTIFGEFKCDLTAVDNFSFAIDLAPGTTNSVAKRSIWAGCHRTGSQGFLPDFDGNASASRLSITLRAPVAATKTGVFVFYTINYRGDV